MDDNPFTPRIPLLPPGEGSGMRAEHCQPFLQCSAVAWRTTHSAASCASILLWGGEAVPLSEADTCRKFVVPKLQAAGWDNEPHP